MEQFQKPILEIWKKGLKIFKFGNQATANIKLTRYFCIQNKHYLSNQQFISQPLEQKKSVLQTLIFPPISEINK